MGYISERHVGAQPPRAERLYSVLSIAYSTRGRVLHLCTSREIVTCSHRKYVYRPMAPVSEA